MTGKQMDGMAVLKALAAKDDSMGTEILPGPPSDDLGRVCEATGVLRNVLDDLRGYIKENEAFDLGETVTDLKFSIEVLETVVK